MLRMLARLRSIMIDAEERKSHSYQAVNRNWHTMAWSWCPFYVVCPYQHKQPEATCRELLRCQSRMRLVCCCEAQNCYSLIFALSAEHAMANRGHHNMRKHTGCTDQPSFSAALVEDAQILLAGRLGCHRMTWPIDFGLYVRPFMAVVVPSFP